MADRLSGREVAAAYLGRLRSYLDAVDVDAVGRVCVLLDDARRAGRSIYVIGNGGSASTASHVATDWGYVAYREGAPNCRVMSLVDNSAIITALGNDVAYGDVFTGQLRFLMTPGDVLVAVSASGNSENLVRAVELARKTGVVTVGFLGFDGGRLRLLCDHVFHVATPRGDYGPVEDIHLMVNHMIAAFLRQPEPAS